MAVLSRSSESVDHCNHVQALRTVSTNLFMAVLFILTLSRISFKRMENISTSDVMTNVNFQDIVFPHSSHQSIIKNGEEAAVVISETLRFGEPLSRLNDNGVETIPDGAKRRLLGISQEAKKEALKGLEKPLLEPPRRALSKSREFLKKIKFLPDLLHDHTLERYNRRVFVAFGTEEQNRVSKQWFYKNYPLRNRQLFEVFEIESSNIDISGWLMENVGEGDYVVLKAEAGAVEEMMMMKGAIRLVDELFLECKNQWGFKERNKSNRAYWECLSLYGRLKDEAVAVHQWWE